MAESKVQLGSRAAWIGFAIRLDTGGAAPNQAKKDAALEAIDHVLTAERVKLAEIASLRGLLAWMANVYEAFRPFLQGLFVLGQADPARKHLLAWKRCPEQVASDLELWRALLQRGLARHYLQPAAVAYDAVVMVDACAGSAAAPGCAWPSGCGIGGVGPPR